ncbi:putative Holliday junction resolvase [Mycoplasmopsis californica]|uniref:Putative pre-16S rRNA nuclease n=1 Tax=Mycoplasmopsis equigenitalium TaxID=114883 RepID=A0ABY5J2Q0_9BACT|nr:Holliday junction resolvase RuvX [Mycoplasmopsis equigenitalium]UUD37275.1 Holliday junction resolvase RuvX [Mycoplasmopsis equigenitalium]VEU69416.1 putative Holliday junction resolvase [Mycoplasmopsis californica]
MRKIALDLGTVTCGVAISDPFDMFAIGLETIKYFEYDFEVILNKIDEYLKEYEIDTIILGYPLRKTSTKSQTTLYVENFYHLLKTKYNLKIVLQDETETTIEARAILKSGGLARRKQKKFKDSLAAQLILERYMGINHE